MGSSAKTRKKFKMGHKSKIDVLFWVKNIKVPFGIGHLPPTHQTLYICIQEGSVVTDLQTILNYLDSFKIYCNSSHLGFLFLGGWGRWVSAMTNYNLYQLRSVQRQRIFKTEMNYLD